MDPGIREGAARPRREDRRAGRRRRSPSQWGPAWPSREGLPVVVTAVALDEGAADFAQGGFGLHAVQDRGEQVFVPGRRRTQAGQGLVDGRLGPGHLALFERVPAGGLGLLVHLENLDAVAVPRLLVLVDADDDALPVLDFPLA